MMNLGSVFTDKTEGRDARDGDRAKQDCGAAKRSKDRHYNMLDNMLAI